MGCSWQWLLLYEYERLCVSCTNYCCDVLVAIYNKQQDVFQAASIAASHSCQYKLTISCFRYDICITVIIIIIMLTVCMILKCSAADTTEDPQSVTVVVGGMATF